MGKNLFLESLDQCRRLGIREKARKQEVFFVMSLRLSDHNIASSVFFNFVWIFSFFFARISYFKFLELRNLIKQLFHSRLLDMRLVIANSALRASYLPSHIQCALME